MPANSSSSSSSSSNNPPSRAIRFDPRLAERLAHKKARLDKFRPLPQSIVRRIGEDLRVLLTYHSNAIEGNTLSLQETKLVIEQGLTIGGHSLREHLEAVNHAQAVTSLVTKLAADNNQTITAQTILDLHRIVMGEIDEWAGQFRRVPVYIVGARITPPPPQQIEGLMAEWVAWANGHHRDSRQYDPLLRAVITHHGFETVHPFTDGNGRTGRLLLNLMLMREGYPPALILKEWRVRYITALGRTDSGDYNALANVIGLAIERSLDMYLEACEEFPDQVYQPLSELAAASGYRLRYLSWLIREGRLPAIKQGGRWLTTRAAIEEYRQQAVAGLEQRGRPPVKPNKKAKGSD